MSPPTHPYHIRLKCKRIGQNKFHTDIIQLSNELIEDYESSPHFRMNIVAFANSKDVSELIVDAAGAEALESGSYTIITLDPDQKEQYPKGGFSAYSDMDRPIDVALPEVVKYLRFMPNLFLLEEVQPFFVLPALFDGEVIDSDAETKLDSWCQDIRRRSVVI